MNLLAQKESKPVEPPIRDAAHGYSPILSGREFSRKISVLGIKKANDRVWQLLMLGILAGLYIGLGGQVSLVALEQGLGRIAAGVAFSIGLVLVVVAGAELFTGNIIMAVGAVTRQFPVARVLRNWLTVYAGNFIGAYALALAITGSGLYHGPEGLNPLGQLAVKVAENKLALSFGAAVLRGILCNILVILAIIMATMAKDIVSKVVCCVLPIMLFVACGFEHCVANMFLVSAGLLAKGVPFAGQAIMLPSLAAVTLGNIIGGLLILFLHPNRLRQLGYLLQAPPPPPGA